MGWILDEKVLKSGAKLTPFYRSGGRAGEPDDAGLPRVIGVFDGGPAEAAGIAPGDEVITHSPYWPTIPEQVKLVGGVPVSIGAHGQREGLGAHWDLWTFQRGGMGDHPTGSSAAGAVCAALFSRERTGEGQLHGSGARRFLARRRDLLGQVGRRDDGLAGRDHRPRLGEPGRP